MRFTMKMIQNVFFALALLLVPMHLAAMDQKPAVETDELAEEGQQISSWRMPNFLLSKKVWGGLATVAVAGGLYKFNAKAQETVDNAAAATRDAITSRPKTAGLGAALLAAAGLFGYNWWTSPAAVDQDTNTPADDNAKNHSPKWYKDLGNLIGVISNDVRMSEEDATALLMPLAAEVAEAQTAFPFIENEKFVSMLSQKLKTQLVKIVLESEQELLLTLVVEMLEDEALVGQLIDADFDKLMSNPGFMLMDERYSKCFEGDKKDAFIAYLRMRQAKNEILAAFIKKHRIVLA